MEWLERVGLGTRAEVAVGELSHGEQKQLELAIALATGPRLLLLDEPMAGLGAAECAAMIDLLRELKRRSRSSWSSTTWMRCSRSRTAFPYWSMGSASRPERARR